MKKQKLTIIILFSILVIIPLIVLGFYNCPSADDFDYGIFTHQSVEAGENIFGLLKSAWQTNVHFYNTWQGLYTSAFVLSLQPAIFGERYYALTTIIVYLSLLLFLIPAFLIINKRLLRKSIYVPITLSFLLASIIFLRLPSATEGFYWFNGAVNYLPWVFAVFLSACLTYELSFYETKNKKFWFYFIIETLLCFIISGANHVTTFANIMLLSYATFKQTKNKKFYSLFHLIIAIIGFYIVMTAPGTAVRQVKLESPGFINTIFYSASYVIMQIPKSFTIDLLFILLATSPFLTMIINNNLEKFPTKFPLSKIFLSFVFICGLYSVPIYAMGTVGAPRLHNVVWVSFIFLFLLNITYIIAFLFKKFPTIKKYVHLVDNFSILIILCSLILLMFLPLNNTQNGKANSSTVSALSELSSGEAEKFLEQNNKRFQLCNDKNLSELQLEPITRETILFFSDLGDNPNSWPNTSMGEYYNKKLIINK